MQPGEQSGGTAVDDAFDEVLKQLLLGFYATVVGDKDYMNQFNNGRRSRTAPPAMMADAEAAITKALDAALALRRKEATPIAGGASNPCVSTLAVWSFVCPRSVMVILGGSGNAVNFKKWVEQQQNATQPEGTPFTLKLVLICSDTKKPGFFVGYGDMIVCNSREEPGPEQEPPVLSLQLGRVCCSLQPQGPLGEEVAGD
jgi:hypothetical protein